MILKATVTTNCEDDKYLRVKVKNTHFWPEESSLLSSVNSIYLEVGDVVLVDYDLEGSSTILGKLLSDEQIAANPIDGRPVLFQSRKGERWVIGTLTSEEFKVTTDDGTFISFINDKVAIQTKSGLEIVSDGDKFMIKNKTVNLAEVLDSFLNVLATTTPTTQGSPAAQNFNPSIINEINTLKTKLSELLK